MVFLVVVANSLLNDVILFLVFGRTNFRGLFFFTKDSDSTTPTLETFSNISHAYKSQKMNQAAALEIKNKK